MEMVTNSNKKVILVVPPFSEQAAMSAEEEFKQKAKEVRVYPPLGLLYLAGELLSRGFEYEIIDSAALMLKEDETINLILHKDPSILGITVTSFTLRTINNLIRKLKKIKPALPIVVGGPHITHWPDSVSDVGADYGIRGDGEKSFSKLVECLFREEAPNCDNIEGLVINKEGERLMNNGVAMVQNLDSLAFPARNLLPEDKYFFVMSYYGKFTTVITSRGCIFDCIYCGVLHKKQLYIRSIDNVINELKVIADSYRYVNFIDECFTIDKNRVIELCNQISKNRLKIKWGCGTRADYVDYKLLKIMSEAGCNDIRFGVESGVDSIRQFSIGKRISNRIFVKAFQDAKKAGLITTGFFLFGHPRETIQDMCQTIHFAKKLNPHYAAFMLATPIPGSRLFDMSLKEGKLTNDIWKKVSVNQAPIPIYTPDQVSVKQMKILQNQALMSFYLRPTSIILKIKEIRSFKELLFKLQLGFSLLWRCILKTLNYLEISNPILIHRQKINLPNLDSLEKLNIPFLDKLTKLIYHPIFGILYQRRFQMALSYLKAKKEIILEIGCGSGLFLFELSTRCYKLYSIDIHNRMEVIHNMLQKERIHNTYLSTGSITKIPYRDKIFDAVVCISVLEHMKDLSLCFQELFRVLKDSGELIIGFPVKNWLTNSLFKLVNYNAQKDHPSSHRDIIDAAESRFLLKSFMVYPRYLPVDYSLYFVGKFVKRR